MNEAMDIPNFETISGRSWIDLTIRKNILAQKTRRWTRGEGESCTDHKLIIFDIETGTLSCNTFTQGHDIKIQNIEENVRNFGVELAFKIQLRE